MSSIVKSSSCLLAAIAIATAAAALAGAGCDAEEVVMSELADSELAATARRVADEEQLRGLAYCYGQGLDELAIRHADRAAGRRLATARYEGCFDPAVAIEVYPLGATSPLRATTGIAEWVEFADGFFAANGYSSTRHLMSNFRIEWTGASTARMESYASIPHFLLAPAARTPETAAPTVEYMIARYVDEARRGPDGRWRTVKKTVYLEEIWRASGYFPGGQGPGR